nr:transposase [Bacillota bacterium]
KETIERVFADMKEKHGMRWTTLRGLKRVSVQAMLVAACMNLKKMANWKWRYGKTGSNPRIILQKIQYFMKKHGFRYLWKPCLSEN